MKINFLFNAHKSYTDNFLPVLKSKFVGEKNVILFEDDLLIYHKDKMNVMIDDAATVYISYEVDSINQIEAPLINAIKEYSSLCEMENRFDNKTPFNVFIPKNSFTNLPLYSLPYAYTVNDIDDAVSLSMHIN